MARKALTKKTRFEVFKRDSFTCQYCGSSAPDVVLNVDHVVPVSGGGDNSVLNLVTSCFSCNAGKSDRALSDGAVVKKQLGQLKLLNERKLQIEMIAEWKAGLVDIENTKAEAVRRAIDKYLDAADRQSTDQFIYTEMKSCIKKYGLDDVLEAVETSARQYLRDVKVQDQRQKFLNMIPRICYWTMHERANPEIAKIRKIAYTANKLWNTCYPRELTKKLLILHRNKGVPVDDLYIAVTSSTGIYKFEDYMKEYLSEAADV